MKYLSLFTLGIVLLFSSCSLLEGPKDPNDPNDPKQDDKTTKELSYSSFNTDLVLEDRNTGVDYFVKDNVNLFNKLLIKPGVTIEFAEGAGFDVRESGSLEAQGTEANPILFTGELKTKGAWKGILVESSSLRNIFKYCTIEFAGSESWGNGVQGGLATWSEGALNVDFCKIKSNKGAGIYFYDSRKVNIRSMDNNTFENNDYSVHVSSYVVHLLGKDNVYADDKNTITIAGGYTFYNEENVNKTWKKMSIPYTLQGETLVSKNNNSLTIEPGTELYFENNSTLTISDNAALIAKGTADEPILMRGVENVQSAWKGLYYKFTSNTKNVLDYIIMQNAGTPADGYNAAIYMWSDPALSVTNSTFEGIFDCVFQDGNSDSFDNPSFSEMNNNFKGNVKAYCN